MIELSIASAVAYGYLIYSLRTFTIPSSFKMGLKWFFTCGKCLTFWAALIVGNGSLIYALLASLTVFLLETFIVTKL